MPIKNVVIMFHQHLTSLWNKTILSNYEFEMVTDWIEYWFNLRSHICTMANDYCECLTKAESPKLKESAIKKSICIYSEYQKLINNERKYPGEENPFEEDGHNGVCSIRYAKGQLWQIRKRTPHSSRRPSSRLAPPPTLARSSARPACPRPSRSFWWSSACWRCCFPSRRWRAPA